jgi:hypothetical protein
MRRPTSFVATAIAMSLASGAPLGQVFPMPRQPQPKAPPEITASLLTAAEAKRARKLAKRRKP